MVSVLILKKKRLRIEKKGIQDRISKKDRRSIPKKDRGSNFKKGWRIEKNGPRIGKKKRIEKRSRIAFQKKIENRKEKRENDRKQKRIED